MLVLIDRGDDGDPGSPGEPGGGRDEFEAPGAASAPTDVPVAVAGGAVDSADRPGPRSDAPVGPSSAGGGGEAFTLRPFGPDRLSQLVLFAAAVSTGTAMAFAFALFGRRRRTDEYDDEELRTAAATPYGMPVPAAAPQFDPGTGGTDVDLPRWRRPSLLAARRSDPIRGGVAAPSGSKLTFGRADGAGAERRRVRYRIVRLLDRPDELAAMTVGSLDEGDEVEVIDQAGLYRRVRTPDGRAGWLHKMTLGDAVEAPGEPEAEIDPDVLVAYLAARGRA